MADGAAGIVEGLVLGVRSVVGERDGAGEEGSRGGLSNSASRRATRARAIFSAGAFALDSAITQRSPPLARRIWSLWSVKRKARLSRSAPR